jgi:hypothetical protein
MVCKDLGEACRWTSFHLKGGCFSYGAAKPLSSGSRCSFERNFREKRTGLRLVAKIREVNHSNGL